MKHTISKALTAVTLTAALLVSVSATAFAAEDTSTADEVNPGNYEYTITDATNVQKAVAKISELTDEQEYLYDIDGVDGISISDATAIQKIVAKIKGQPTYHEETITTTVEHPAEYETVTKQVWVEGEEITEERPVYIYSSRQICHGISIEGVIDEKCGIDITQYTDRYDEAVANGEIVPGDGNYEKLTKFNGHYYNFSGGTIHTLVLAAGETGYDANGNWVTAKKDIYSSIDSDTPPCHSQIKTIQKDDGTTLEYRHDGWYSAPGWYALNIPEEIDIYDFGTNETVEIDEITLDSNVDVLDIFSATDAIKLSDNEIDKMYELIETGKAQLQTVRVKCTGSAYFEFQIVYQPITTTTEGHYEEVTEEVLVKEAYTETVTVPGGRWYCD